MIKFGMLLVNNNRSKAYLQNLLREGFVPTNVIILKDNSKLLPEQLAVDTNSINQQNEVLLRKIDNIDSFFNENEHIITTLKNNNVPFTIINHLDLNSEDVLSVLKSFPEEYIIYSGPGGSILSKDLVETKKFIHIHPGWLPVYKGSTTIYYSMLIENQVSATAIIMSSEIDKGDMLFRKKFTFEQKDINFDYVLDTCVRADTLLCLFKKIKSEGISKIHQQQDDFPYFYIVHPMIKHFVVQQHVNN